MHEPHDHSRRVIFAVGLAAFVVAVFAAHRPEQQAQVAGAPFEAVSQAAQTH
jgi:hypothetical protein